PVDGHVEDGHHSRARAVHPVLRTVARAGCRGPGRRAAVGGSMGRRGGSLYVATDPHTPLSIGTPGVAVAIGPVGPTISAGSGLPAGALISESTGDGLGLESTGDTIITESGGP